VTDSPSKTEVGLADTEIEGGFRGVDFTTKFASHMAVDLASAFGSVTLAEIE
jgi:hypothetical protein